MAKKDISATADLTKKYVSTFASIIEGKPTSEGQGVPVTGMTEERLQAYIDAGLLTVVEVDSPNEDAALEATLAEAVDKIDTSEDLKV